MCIPCGLGADIAPLGVGGGSAAAKSLHQTIRMDSEDVTIQLGQGSYTVNALFHFSNSGDTTTTWVGFPRGEEYFERIQRDLPDFVQFHAWVDGKKVPFSKEGNRWLARQVTFPGHAKTTIRVLYEAKYYRGGRARYIIGTGSLWKDSIGRAAFTVDGSAIGGTKHFTASLKAAQSHRLLSDKAVRIEVTNYEPEPNTALHITVNRPTKPVSR